MNGHDRIQMAVQFDADLPAKKEIGLSRCRAYRDAVAKPGQQHHPRDLGDFGCREKPTHLPHHANAIHPCRLLHPRLWAMEDPHVQT